MKFAYIDKRFSNNSLEIIDHANVIIDEYGQRGFDLTLRQLYYQFVARALIPNKQSEYKRLGSIINDARLAGLVDWNSIVDRTRHLESNSHWNNPGEIIRTCVSSFMLDRWEGQEYRPEVWVEKDALVGVLAKACDPLDVPYFSCRGYSSQSAMWGAGERFNHTTGMGQVPFVIHLADHDPSGLDMSHDIEARLKMFCEDAFEYERIALNMDQVEEFNPPPNPAKITDSRYEGYVAKYGEESWELDALDPGYISQIIESKVTELRDQDLWNEMLEKEGEYTRTLAHIAANWQSP